MVSPMGGDGGVVIVDPNNANRAVNEYVYMTMARTQNGGRSDGSTNSYTTITPTCATVIEILYDPHAVRPEPAVHRAVHGRPEEHQPLGQRWPVRLGQPGCGLEHVVQQRHL